MSKILAKSGDSLADVYDVEGSIAGIDDLVSREVNLVHEMGATIFSERLAGRMLDISSGAILQNIQFDVNFSVSVTSRILALQVVTTSSTRLNRVQVSITSPPSLDNSDVPIWVWDSNDGFRFANVLTAGALASINILVPAMTPQIPTLLVGQDSPRQVSTITLRGLTTGFGAGNVTTRLILYVAFPQLGGVSSRGLPLPGW